MLGHNPSFLASLNSCQDGAIRGSKSHIFSLNAIYQSRPSKPRAKTNCRSIEIPLIVPRPSSTSQYSTVYTLISNQDEEMALVGGTNQSASRDQPEKEQSFPFLSLPFEIRLKICALVLPSRRHTIVTQYPHNGYYYSRTSMVSRSTQTLLFRTAIFTPLDTGSVAETHHLQDAQRKLPP